MSVCLSVVSVCLSVSLSVCLSVSVCVSLSLSVSVCLCLSLCLLYVSSVCLLCLPRVSCASPREHKLSGMKSVYYYAKDEPPGLEHFSSIARVDR